MKLTRVKKVYETGLHVYGNFNDQAEHVARVLLETGRRCWLVAYGGDFMPASKSDLENICIDNNDDCRIYEGMIVYAYRNN